MSNTVDLGALINAVVTAMDYAWEFMRYPIFQFGIFTYNVFSLTVAFVIGNLLIDIIDDYDDERIHFND